MKETKFKVGQTVWCILNGEGKVVSLNYDSEYPVTVLFNETEDSYTIDGKILTEKNRALFFSEPQIIADTEPSFEPKLKKGDKVLVTYLGESSIIEVQNEVEDRIAYTEEGHYWPKNNKEVKFYKLPEVQLITFD